MKTRLLLIALALFLTGCDPLPEPYNSLKTRQAVIDTFETTDIYVLPNDSRHIVRAKDGAIWLVDTQFNKITSRALIFPTRQ